jgi:hypothetical protein
LYRARAQRADACAAQSHSDVIQKLLKKARKGTKSASISNTHISDIRVSLSRTFACHPAPAVVAMPGNHDEALRDYLQDTNIELGENMCAPRCAVPCRALIALSSSSSIQAVSRFDAGTCLRSTVTLETEHTTADGRRFLVLHGDRCDVIRHGACLQITTRIFAFACAVS